MCLNPQEDQIFIDTTVKSHIRRYQMLTLTDAHLSTRAPVSIDTIRKRLLKIYPAETKLIASKERHKNNGFHFHVGLLTYISKNGLEEKVRKALREWGSSSKIF